MELILSFELYFQGLNEEFLLFKYSLHWFFGFFIWAMTFWSNIGLLLLFCLNTDFIFLSYWIVYWTNFRFFLVVWLMCFKFLHYLGVSYFIDKILRGVITLLFDLIFELIWTVFFTYWFLLICWLIMLSESCL